jgi:hypothetical protein
MSALGAVYMHIFVKDTTFHEDSVSGFGVFGKGDKEVGRIELSQKERK